MKIGLSKIGLLVIFLVLPFGLKAQKARVFGHVRDSLNRPLEGVNIAVAQSPLGTASGKNGSFELFVPAGKPVLLVFSYAGYQRYQQNVELSPGGEKQLNVQLRRKVETIDEVKIIDNSKRTETIMRLDPKIIEFLPDASGSGIEAIIKTLPGVSSRSELSSQYSVRGGNFDENLVYVNDIEVYRPFLIRAGQQEGLSFINPDMVASIMFSAGGFDAKYGDKMSSVLDISYKKPTKFAAGVSGSLLGGSAHIEAASENKRLTFISGFRYKTSKYLLGSLETKGEYLPSFLDFQSFLTFDLSPKWEIAFLGNVSQNQFEFQPQDRSTDFGTVQNALNLYIDFEGNELDKFRSLTGALTAQFQPNQNLKIKWIASAYHTLESETFDIQGRYSLNQLDKNLGSETFGDSIMNLGIGKYIDHARNYLSGNVFSFALKGYLTHENNQMQWGAKVQREIILDQLSEWKLMDSAGFSLPYPNVYPYTGEEVSLFQTTRAENELDSYRFTAYWQNKHDWSLSRGDLTLTAGLRANYWNFTGQLLISPRATIAFQPYWQRDILFKFATGHYAQPPFYKELRRHDGSINPNVKAQESVHFVLGTDFNFTAWKRPFKFVGEMYYKYLNHIVPYEVDNVRIRYFPDIDAFGYATGLDLKVNGEFVKGVDSWASLSVMQTKENVRGDNFGYIPRPTDQTLTAGVFFQDYFPGQRGKSWTMHLTMLYGSRLPFGEPGSERKNATLRMPAYKRVDIGFSKIFKDENQKIGMHRKILKPFKQLSVSAEIFNLLGVNNTISYLWLKVVPNTTLPNPDTPAQFAVPNRLTARRFNIKLIAKF